MVTADILSAILPCFGLGVFAARKPQGFVTVGLHADLKQWPPDVFCLSVCAPRKFQALVTADILSAILADFGLGVLLRKNPRKLTILLKYV
jgi:hypothetical protein